MSGRHGGHGRVLRPWFAVPVTILVAVLVAVLGLLALGHGLPASRHDAEPPTALATSSGGSPGGTAATVPALPASPPVRIRIAAIAVDSSVQQLGLTSAGALAVPAAGAHYDEVGWYRFSPTPGEVGPSVFVGHVDSATTGRSVFWDLGTLRPGARVVVTRADGSVLRFAVTRLARYDKTGFPTALVYGNTARAELRLITCGGPIDQQSGHYRDNVVAFASLVPGAT